MRVLRVGSEVMGPWSAGETTKGLCRARTKGGGLVTGAEPASRLGSSWSISSSLFVGAPNKPVLPFVGGLTPGGADPVNERSLSARWRKSDDVSGLGAATWPDESQELSLRWLHGSLES